MVVSIICAVEELGRPVRISHQTTVMEVRVSLNWAVWELGRPVRISHKNDSRGSGSKHYLGSRGTGKD